MTSKAMLIQQSKLQALIDLENAQGSLKPIDLVNAARKKDHPFHNSFEWDDKKAASRYRLDQAREIVRNFQVVNAISSNETDLKLGDRYIRDPRAAENEGGMVRISHIRNDEEVKRLALINEFSQAAASLQRAYDIAKEFGAREEIPELVHRIELLKKQVREDTAVRA